MSKKRSRLSVRLVIGFVLLGLFISAAAIGIAYIKYKTAVEKEYNDKAYRIADLAMTYVDGDAIARYLQTGVTDAAYEELGEQLSVLREKMEVNHIFIARAEGIKLVYVIDTDNPDDGFEPFRLLDEGNMNPLFEEDVRKVMAEGIRSPNYFYSRSQFGYNTSALVPIYDSGDNPVAALVIEVPMAMLLTTLTDFAVFTSVASALLIALFIGLFLFYLQRKVVAPIQLITREADAFVKREAEVSEKLPGISTGDEIELLARSIHQMEVDIKDYIKSLTEAATERERMEAELNIATQIQASMLPRAFDKNRAVDLYASMVPAREVGGDFYDYFMLDEHRLAFLVADVSGKGIPAALFMVVAKTLLKNQASAGLPAQEVFESVNNLLADNNEANMFVTAWMGVLDLHSGEVTYASAGHNPPLLKRRDGGFEFLKKTPGFVLGGMEGLKFQARSITMEAGDTLFLYTDGVTEATNAALALYGEDQLSRALNEEKELTPRALVGAVSVDIQRFVGEAPQFDDITMLAVRLLGRGETSLTVPAKAEHTARVLDFLEEGLRQAGVLGKDSAKMLLVMDEMVSNIVQYSGSDTLTAGLQVQSGKATITLRDSGLPFNPFLREDPDTTLSAEERGIGGLGTFIARQLMDRADYRFENGENIVTLEKTLREEGAT